MRRIIEYFITHRRITNMIVLLAFLAGMLSLMLVKRKMFPDVSFDSVQIRTVYPGASPEDVELYVTDKIEEKLLEVENIKRMTSTSFENYSVITLQIDGEAGDPDKTRENIREALSRVNELPAAVSERPQYTEIKTSNVAVLEIALTGDDEGELRRYARSLESMFKDVPGVARVDKSGYRKREILIEADLDLLSANQLPFGVITASIAAHNVRNSGGTLESYVSDKKIVTLSEFKNPLEVRDVIVRSNTLGYSLTVGDVAVISDTFEEPTTIYRANGHRAIGITVVAGAEADIMRLGSLSKSVLEKFKKTLPPTVKAQLVSDNSIFTSIMIDMMLSNGLMGFVLVLVVLFFFLDFKSGFWCAFGIPFSIITSFALFPVLGLSINLITLTSMILLLGILVDDAIVITEKIHTIRKGGANEDKSLIDGVLSMAMPVAASVITTILAFLPLKFLPGVMGRFVSDIPVVVILLLGISFIDAVLFLPAHLRSGSGGKAPVVKAEKESRRNAVFASITRAYERFVAFCLQNRAKVFVSFVLGLFALLALTSLNMRFMLDEDIDPDSFQILVEAEGGTSLYETEMKVARIEKLVLESLPQELLMGITSEVGHHDTDFFGVSTGLHSEWALIRVNLIPSAKRKTTCEELIAGLVPQAERLREELRLPKLSVSIPAGLPVGKAIELTIVADDDYVRSQRERELLDCIITIPGVKNIESSNVEGKEELTLLLNYRELAKTGLSSANVASTIRSAFEGEVVTTIRSDGEKVNYRVKLKDSENFREERVLMIPATNAEGRMVRLEHVAYFAEQLSPAMITREGGKRSVTISADVDPSLTNSSEANALIGDYVLAHPSPDTHLIFGGQQAESQQSMQGFVFAGLFVVVSIYFILVVLFDSYMLPAMIMSIVPFAVAATFLTLLLHGRPLIMLSLLGMLGLVGVVVNDTIVMIDHLTTICKSGLYTVQQCARAAADRLRPVCLTTITTFFGLLPTAYGLGGDVPSIRPMVLVMAWGLFACTVVTLVFIPVLYTIVRPPKVER